MDEFSERTLELSLEIGEWQDKSESYNMQGDDMSAWYCQGYAEGLLGKFTAAIQSRHSEPYLMGFKDGMSERHGYYS